MFDNRGTGGISPQTSTSRENRSKRFSAKWVAVTVSVVALTVSAVNIILYYHLQQQANAISKKSISVQQSIQAQSNATSDRNTAAEVSVVFLTGANGGLEITNASASQFANATVVFLPANWSSLPPSTRSPDGILHVYKLLGCADTIIPARVTLPNNQTAYLPPGYAYLYFTDPDGNYWVTNSAIGTVSKVSGIRAPNLPYRATAPDITSEFMPHNSFSHLSSCSR